MSSPIIHEAITESPDPAELMPVEVTSAFPRGASSVLSAEEQAAIDTLIEEVPDENDTFAINYWRDMNGKKVYLEGWIDKCLAGTGFPPMERGEWDEKIQYMIRVGNRTLIEKQEEKNRPIGLYPPGHLNLIEGGFREFEAGENEWLYGVTWGVYEKAEGGNPMTKEATNDMAVTDEEFASHVAKYVASIPTSVFARMKPGALTEPILAMAREKGYEDGPRFVKYFKTPEGQAFYLERYRLERKIRRPIPELALTEEEKSSVISEFKRIMEREPTPAEMYELYAEELKFKRKGVPV